MHDRVLALLSVMHGGQVITDCTAFHGINAALPSIAKAVPKGPELSVLAPDAAAPAQTRWAHGTRQMNDVRSSSGQMGHVGWKAWDLRPGHSFTCAVSGTRLSAT